MLGGEARLGLFHPRTRLDVELTAKDNLAFAVPLGAYYLGILIVIGNVLRLAVSGPFEGWGVGLASASGYALAGLAILFAARWLFDWLLLPGVTIRQEILEQAVPNTGVGYLEGLFYLGTSFLIAWAL